MHISRRHHYIPQFFIRKFTDATEHLYVYDKETKKTKHSSTKHAYFEWERNLVEVEGQRIDNLERLYSDLDTELAKDLQKILRGGRIEQEDVISICVLASMQKWRVPAADASFEQLKHDTSLQNLKVELRYTGSAEDFNHDALRRIEESELFKAGKRINLSILPFLDSDEFLIRIHNKSRLEHYSDERIKSNLLGDCTIIEKPGSAYNELGNFIFPLSSRDTFIYRDNPNPITPLFKVSTDLAMVHFSTRYVGCCDKDYLAKIVASYYQSQNLLGEKLEGYLLQSLF